MNFLLHHHLATQDLGSGLAGVGAMLPDVWRMVDRRVRPRRGAAEAAEAVDEVGEDARRLLAGVEHHLEADEIFHRHQVFVGGERRLAERFRGSRIEADKIGLFAHIAWELCLDGALLERQGTDEVLHRLRDDIDAAAGAPQEEVVRAHQRELDPGFDERLGELLRHIAWSEWVPGYAHGQGLADRVSGVRRRIGLEPLRGDDRRRVAEVLDAALVDAGPALERFLADWPGLPSY